MSYKTQAGFTRTLKLSMTPKGNGFTLLELTLVVAMIGFIAMFSVSFGTGLLWRTDLSSAQYSTVVALRHAQVLAQSVQEDSDWGVHIENNELILFKGNDFQTRDISKDESSDLGSVTVSSPIDVIYHKFSGRPYLSSYEINLMTTEETTVVNINSEGTVIY